MLPASPLALKQLALPAYVVTSQMPIAEQLRIRFLSLSVTDCRLMPPRAKFSVCSAEGLKFLRATLRVETSLHEGSTLAELQRLRMLL